MRSTNGTRVPAALLLLALVPFAGVAAEASQAPTDAPPLAADRGGPAQGVAFVCGGREAMQGLGKELAVDGARLLPNGLWELTLRGGSTAYYRQDGGEFCFVDNAPED